MIQSNIAALHHTQTPTIVGDVVGRGPSAWTGAVRTWFERSRQRRALAELDDRLLDDIGITRSQAQSEVARPFWHAGKA
jgi:uncharacterized protein YjiS (DUF1127 family)